MDVFVSYQLQRESKQINFLFAVNLTSLSCFTIAFLISSWISRFCFSRRDCWKARSRPTCCALRQACEQQEESWWINTDSTGITSQSVLLFKICVFYFVYYLAPTQEWVCVWGCICMKRIKKNYLLMTAILCIWIRESENCWFWLSVSTSIYLSIVVPLHSFYLASSCCYVFLTSFHQSLRCWEMTSVPPGKIHIGWRVHNAYRWWKLCFSFIRIPDASLQTANLNEFNCKSMSLRFVS